MTNPLSPLVCKTLVEIPDHARRQEKEVKDTKIGKEEKKDNKKYKFLQMICTWKIQENL